MVLAPRRPAAPANAITADLTADLPPGTSARVDVRGVLPTGAWSRWIPTRDGVRTVLPSATTQVQARIVLLGGSGAVSPAVERLWLTTSTTTATLARDGPRRAQHHGGPAGPQQPSATTPTKPTKPTKPARPRPGPGRPGRRAGLARRSSRRRPNAPATSAPPSVPSPRAPGRPRPVGTTTSPPGPGLVHAVTSSPAPPRTGRPGGRPRRRCGPRTSPARSLGMFKDTPWNFVGAKQPTVVPATDLPGQKALKFTMPGGAKRAEVEPNVDNFTEGQDRYIRLTVRLAPGFPMDSEVPGSSSPSSRTRARAARRWSCGSATGTTSSRAASTTRAATRTSTGRSRPPSSGRSRPWCCT